MSLWGLKASSPAQQLLWGTSRGFRTARKSQESFSTAVESATHWMVEGVIIHVKVGGVHGPSKLRDIGGSAGCQPLPVHTLEEGVVPKVVQPSAAQTLLLAAQQLADQVLGTGWHIGHIWGELQMVLQTQERGAGQYLGSHPLTAGITNLLDSEVLLPSQNTGTWQTDLMVHDLAIGFHQGFRVEGRLSEEQLIGADPQ